MAASSVVSAVGDDYRSAGTPTPNRNATPNRINRIA